jgi:sulfur-oxidizing protein SoxY
MRGLAWLAALGLATATAARAAPPAPLGSPTWQALAPTFFGTDPVHFDDRVHVRFPEIAEDQHQFPVEVDARGIAGVRRLLIFADLNPIPLAIDYAPGRSQPFLATRIKLDQRTPVRGAVQLADGSWLVSGGWIDAAGGGCSAPPVSRVKGDWAQHLGEVRGRVWAADGSVRVRLAFRHPMDTGFVANIATYNLETVRLTGADGADDGTAEMEASVAEDPALTLITAAGAGEVLAVAGRDTNGIDYAATVRVSPVSAAR